MRYIAVGFFIVGFGCCLLLHHVYGRDLDGKYEKSDPQKHAWFDHLKSERGLCCSFADGEAITDAQWDTKDGHYRVFLDDHWIDIPDGAVIKEANRYGTAVVWPIRDRSTNGGNKVYDIRCFIPGSGM